MGVELHIVRRNDFDNYEEDSNITFDEWKAMVESDDELTWKQDGQSNDETDYTYCYWLKHPEPEENNLPWFNYGAGMISTKWILSPCFEKLNEMAAKLGGRVEGDEGELTEADINYLKNPELFEDFKNAYIPKKSHFGNFGKHNGKQPTSNEFLSQTFSDLTPGPSPQERGEASFAGWG